MATPLVLVGTDDGLHTLGSDSPRLSAAKAIDHVVLADGGVWAISDGRTIWHGPAMGKGQPVAELTDFRANCLLVIGDRVLVGAGDAALFELSPDGLARVAHFDTAAGRSEWYTPWGDPPDVRSIARGVDGTLYVNVHVGGVVRSVDNGADWAETIDIHADVHQVVTDLTEPGHVFAATAQGLATTTTGGDDWEFTQDGLHASYCRAVATSATSIFLSASTGPNGHRSALYRKPLAGGQLERCANGLPEWFSGNINTHCLAAVDDFVAVGDPGGAVYTSRDDGRTWEPASDGLPGVRCLAIGPVPVRQP